MSRYKEIYIDRFNMNIMVIVTNSGKETYIAIPPGRNRIDLMSYDDFEFKGFCNYHYGFNGLTIITSNESRLILDENANKLDEMFFKKEKQPTDDYIDDPNQPWNWKK